MKFFLLITAVLAFVIACEAATHFCYDTEKECSTWPDDACKNGKQQSPIDINTETLKSQKPIHDTFIFNNRYKNGVPSKSYITNNGHTVQLSATKDATSTMTLLDETEQTTYVFAQVHCHWESEHRINNETFGLECHFVHYNSKFANVSDAAASNTTGSLVIIGVVFKREQEHQGKSPNFIPDVLNLIKNSFGNAEKNDKKPTKNTENIYMRPITDNLSVSKAGNVTNGTVEIEGGFNVHQMINPSGAREIEAYHYMGSLTTPGCNEGMRWFVVKEPQTLSNEQWAAFDKVKNGEGDEKMKGNRRPLQPLNGRVVKLVRIQFQ